MDYTLLYYQQRQSLGRLEDKVWKYYVHKTPYFKLEVDMAASCSWPPESFKVTMDIKVFKVIEGFLVVSTFRFCVDHLQKHHFQQGFTMDARQFCASSQPAAISVQREHQRGKYQYHCKLPWSIPSQLEKWNDECCSNTMEQYQEEAAWRDRSFVSEIRLSEFLPKGDRHTVSIRMSWWPTFYADCRRSHEDFVFCSTALSTALGRSLRRRTRSWSLYHFAVCDSGLQLQTLPC